MASSIPAPAPLRQIRMVTATMAAATPLIVVVMFFVLRHTDLPSLIAIALLVVVSGLAAIGIQTVGFRTAPAAHRSDWSPTRSVGVFQSLAMVRAALGELPLFAGLVLAFALPPSTWYT